MPNKEYFGTETAFFFADAAQTPSAQLTLTGLPANQGRVSAQYDRGAATQRAALYEWRFRCQLTGTNQPGAVVELYAITTNVAGGANPDGEVGTADLALSTTMQANKRFNAKLMGYLVVDQDVSNTTMTASGLVMLVTRYLSILVWNATTLPFNASTSAHRLTMTPVAREYLFVP